MHSKNLLFLLKRTESYGDYSSLTSKSGLLNSAKITASQLHKHLGIKTEIEICVDANEIDKFVTKHRPSIVIIEALWVLPSKFPELVRLHPKVRFIVLVHSNVPFLSNEGPAIGYIREYVGTRGVHVAFNSVHAYNQFAEIGIPGLFLPNIYHDVHLKASAEIEWKPGTTLDIGCFGALRPMKNQLIQAFAAITAALILNAKMHFHINSTRPEQGGEAVLKNLRALFAGHHRLELVEHPWSDRETFLSTIRRMDLGMQVSFSETFNIVSADFVMENVPIVVSKQIEWMPWQEQADMYDVDDMVGKMLYALEHKHRIVKRNIKALSKYTHNSLLVWSNFLKNNL